VKAHLSPLLADVSSDSLQLTCVNGEHLAATAAVQNATLGHLARSIAQPIASWIASPNGPCPIALPIALPIAPPSGRRFASGESQQVRLSDEVGRCEGER
jgi:hypothetical protein